jgi:tetratricopeptide (TPR) repeat protein
MGAEIKRGGFGSGFFNSGEKLIYYSLFVIFAFIYTNFVFLILPQIAEQQTRLLLLGITYLCYIGALSFVIITYFRKRPGRPDTSRHIAPQSISESPEPQYTLEFIAGSEYVNRIEELFKPKYLDHIKINLQDKMIKERSLVDEAFLEYSQAIGRDAKDHGAHNNIGNIYVYKNMADEAIKEYLEAIRLKPDSYRAYSNLGIACLLIGKYDEAIVVLRESLKLQPDHAAAHNNLGIVYLKKQLFDDAVREFEAALKTAPDNDEIRRNLELCLAIKKAYMHESISGSFP